MHNDPGDSCKCNMAKLFFIPFLVFLISCRDNKLKLTFPDIDRSDINQIIEAVIHFDSLPFYNTSDTSFIPLSTNLRKIYVTPQGTTPDIPPPVNRQKIPAYTLLNSLVKNEIFFPWSDTAFFYFKNNLTDTFTLEKALTNKIATTNIRTRNATTDNTPYGRYYDLTIPIFSADQRKAYIVCTKNCSGCGGATAFFLEKTASKWTIIGWRTLWRE